MSLAEASAIGKNALAAHSLRLDIHAKNVANVDTPNYVRRIPILNAAEDISFHGLLNKMKTDVFGVGTLPYTQGGVVVGDTKSFEYHAITAEDNGDGTIRVNLGPAVCRLRFQVFPENHTAGDEAIIDYTTDDLTGEPGYPEYVDIEIPGFYDLDPSLMYDVVISAFDCSGGTTPLEEVDIVVGGVVAPPNTGSINIFGLTISRIDYVVTGVLAFISVAIIAFFPLRRKKTSRR